MWPARSLESTMPNAGATAAPSRTVARYPQEVVGMAQCCGHDFQTEEACSRTRGPAKIMAAVRVPPATEEVIHCLQSQGSPAATSQSCKLHPGDTSNLGGPLRAAPFFCLGI